MDTILAIVTLLSLATAIGMGLFVAKLLREERHRSDARVAALAELASEPSAAQRPARVAAVEQARRPRQTVERSPIADLEIRPASAARATDLFVAKERSSPWGPRLAIIAPMAIVIGVGLFGATARIDSPLEDNPPRQQQAALNAAARPSLPLELLSLRHAQQDGRFTVAGVVQNPHEGAPLSRIAATVVMFGSDGRQLAGGRAPLDFTTLAPGDESPFVIEVRVTQIVTRYRVGFRGEGDRIIEHVDRRTPADALARK